MAARGWSRIALALLAAAVLGGLAGGCGTTFKMPTETRANRTTPGQGTYSRVGTWSGMGNIQDLLLTPGGEFFLVFQDQVARQGQVRRYLPTRPIPLSGDFPGLMNPTAICFGANRLFVLDQGDTNAARSNFPCYYSAEHTADVDTASLAIQGFSRPITNIASYWHVREYLLDGTLVDSFTDTTFAWVNGIAADAAGRVYVAGSIMYSNVSPFDDHVRTLEFRFRIRRYEHGTRDRYIVGGSWRRDLSYKLLEGTGVGSTKDPRGMQWLDPQGAALYFADMGNNQVQRFGDPVGGAPSFKLNLGGAGTDSMLFAQPNDVAVDSAGYVYLVDAGNLRVLRFDGHGNFVQRVDRTPDSTLPPMTRPVAVAADNRYVYIADRGAGEVLRYWRLD